MPRYALKIEYDGAPFAGWQRQTDQPSVQAAVETALAKLEPRAHRITGAGRTDAGVHATGQVAHADMARDWDPFRLSQALNYHLKPAPIAITACAAVADDWHARFSATRRHYLFRIIARRAPLIHDRGLAWQVKVPLDLDAMQKAAAHLLGTHDFTTFRATLCQANTPVKTLEQLDLLEILHDWGSEIRLHVAARSFLHNQIRSFAGSLERVGSGAWAPDDVKSALEARDRTACGPVAPPQGLYLSRVDYADPPFDRSTA